MVEAIFVLALNVVVCYISYKIAVRLGWIV